MRKVVLAAAVAAALAVISSHASARPDDDRGAGNGKDADVIQLGPRPFYLVDGMDDGALKKKLMQCKNDQFRRTDFSIGHRGAALQFPEHTMESYNAGARMGAGIVECDVTFTKYGELVCRHSEADLHTTTNIVAVPELNAKCTKPFTPATFDSDGTRLTPASAECRTSDLTLAEFKMLTGKMDASNPSARTPEEFLGGTASWRTDLYTGRGTVVTMAESVRLNQMNGVKHTPELKGGDPERIKLIFGSQEQYAQKFIDELETAGVEPKDVWPQSFNLNDVLYWINHTRYGKQAVYLDSIDPTVTPPIPRLTLDQLKDLRKQGVRIIAPPMWALLAVTNAGEVVPSDYAKDIKKAKLDIITWTFERADLRRGASQGGWYYLFDPQGKAIKKDSDMYKALDVLAKKVKILGIFSDWPATVTYYANCMGLK